MLAKGIFPCCAFSGLQVSACSPCAWSLSPPAVSFRPASFRTRPKALIRLPLTRKLATPTPFSTPASSARALPTTLSALTSPDIPGNGSIPIHCSQDKMNWVSCGSVFPAGMPDWIQRKVPGVIGLVGARHLLFQRRVSPLLQRFEAPHAADRDRPRHKHHARSADPAYKWVDRGMVLQSKQGDDFNALDPTILIDSDKSVWLTYGSYWSGIKQRQIDPVTGTLLASNPTRYDLATRPGVPQQSHRRRIPHPPRKLLLSLRLRGLLLRTEQRAKQLQTSRRTLNEPARSLPRRERYAHDEWRRNGLAARQQNLECARWRNRLLRQRHGESLIVFHAHNLDKSNMPYQWLKTLKWQHDWPVIGD